MKLPSYATPFETFVYYATLVFTGLVLLFLISPIIAIMPLSFNAEPYFSYPMPGLSLRWYDDFFTNERWMSAVKISLLVAALVTVLATALGTLAAPGLSRAGLPFKPLILGVLISPMIVPVIITAAAIDLFYAQLGLLATISGLVLAA